MSRKHKCCTAGQGHPRQKEKVLECVQVVLVQSTQQTFITFINYNKQYNVSLGLPKQSIGLTSKQSRLISWSFTLLTPLICLVLNFQVLQLQSRVSIVEK
ncbi:hypothetical protein FGO68_gene15310 [Halteria grandinella]|uniref:Uncharacterized protein n=1 Tax=Halteria grandinella TaxID=5974 RepID=A0A8J8P3Z6_HALGN|nr:hypothetical protein FGO68_gene15310 [Halteria grandinella]